MTLIQALFVALVVLNLLDVYTTCTILRQGGSEVNSVMSWMMGKIGVIPALVAPKAAFLVAVWFCLPLLHVLVLVGLVCMYVWIVWHNFGQIKK